jgi:hypothetical protein
VASKSKVGRGLGVRRISSAYTKIFRNVCLVKIGQDDEKTENRPVLRSRTITMEVEDPRPETPRPNEAPRDLMAAMMATPIRKPRWSGWFSSAPPPENARPMVLPDDDTNASSKIIPLLREPLRCEPLDDQDRQDEQPTDSDAFTSTATRTRLELRNLSRRTRTSREQQEPSGGSPGREKVVA